MKHFMLKIFFTLLLTHNAFGATDIPVNINCITDGAGIVPLNVEITSPQTLENLKEVRISVQGQNSYLFEVSVQDSLVVSDLVAFDFFSDQIEGRVELNFTDGRPSGDGVIDLTKKPILPVAVFDKYVLRDCK